MKYNVLAGSIFTLLMVALSANSEAQLSIKAGNVTAEANVSTSQPGNTTSKDMEDRVKALQDSIVKATDRLQNAGKSSAEKTKQLDALAESVQSALKEVSPNGGLYSELKKTIDSTEAKSKAWHDKSIDPNVSAQMQLKYRGLENKFSAAKDMLYKGMIALDAQRVDLEKRLKDVKENRDFVVEMMAAGDLEDATKAVLDVVSNMSSVNKSFDNLLQNISGAGISEKTQ